MAAGSTVLFAKTVIATATITGGQGITLAGAVPAAGASGYVAEFSGVSGDAITANLLGTTVAISGAAFAANALLEFNASGKMITKTTGIAVARSITAATAADQQIEVLILPN
jgi:hypothetical protein